MNITVEEYVALDEHYRERLHEINENWRGSLQRAEKRIAELEPLPAENERLKKQLAATHTADYEAAFQRERAWRERAEASVAELKAALKSPEINVHVDGAKVAARHAVNLVNDSGSEGVPV